MNVKFEKYLVVVFGIAFNIGIYVLHVVVFFLNQSRRPETFNAKEEIYELVNSLYSDFWVSSATLLLSIIYFIYIDKFPFLVRMVALLAMILVALGTTLFILAYGA